MAVPDEEASAGGGSAERQPMRKSAWTKSEDAVLLEQVKRYGPQNWKAISAALPGRNGKSCRLRYCQHLDPEVDGATAFTAKEDAMILHYQRMFPNKWATIAGYFPGRTDNAIKNRWNSVLRKQLQHPHPHPQPPHQESTGGGGPRRDGRTLTLFRPFPGDVKMQKPIKGPVLDHMPTAADDDVAEDDDQSGACLNLFPLAPGDIVNESGAAPMDVDCGADDPLTQLRLFPPSAPKVAYPPMTAAAAFRAMVQAVRAS